MLQVAMNGSRHIGDSVYLPAGVQAIAADAAAAVTAGACSVHVHIRDRLGEETLSAPDVGGQLEAIRQAVPGVPVGISTGAWIVPDVTERLACIAAWEVLPDFVSVNFDEDGHEAVAHAVLQKGIGIEAGINSVYAAKQLIRSGLLSQCFRILLEPPAAELPAALALVTALEELLLPLPETGQVVLLHGVDHTSWPLLELAYAKGYQSRIGLEDTLYLPGGILGSNAEMVSQGIAIAQRKHR
ncbi:3-keto-5-aminohexanoate cleavage protein [Chitinophaga pendula]|uniref:3-keto-5-aminohexanoate cleavage protein n=1 Tax=Chitinophaga TaxID=79328 RepID=UPI0012FD7BC2|nr:MULTISPECIES: 3-keto-5-aminohexanoate cleavage protein [Chitinophaga]UCJ06712.1 3-keto-5-aminohexanoate cleavage protein [Chitinophaga pendula]